MTTHVKAKVILFKPSGKYYTEEEWEVPTRQEVIDRGGMPGDSIGPYCMQFSKDFRRIGGTGAVLIETQEPWGYPHLFNAIVERPNPSADADVSTVQCTSETPCGTCSLCEPFLNM